jgi:hypothetical protein
LKKAAQKTWAHSGSWALSAAAPMAQHPEVFLLLRAGSLFIRKEALAFS